jgi:glutamate synthase (NADPH/NADH)
MVNYQTAVGKGLLKVMSKMGISTLQSYKGAQVFEAIGIGSDVIERCFHGTTSRLEGVDFQALYRDIERLHALGYDHHHDHHPHPHRHHDLSQNTATKKTHAHSHLDAKETHVHHSNPSSTVLIRNPGQYHARENGEVHFNTPAAVVALQAAARTNSRDAYNVYRDLTVAASAKVTLRGVLDFCTVPTAKRPPQSAMEPIGDIVKRFNTGAMSLGSISQETHEALAVAMNHLGGRSNTGEGGEDPARYMADAATGAPNAKRSAIKQVASGRFGVTMEYLTNADQLQIKMAQGAKPGEGGELPGHKVSDYIAARRHTTPGVGLISPPVTHRIE